LENSEIINKKGKRSYEETVQQEKTKFSKIERRKQHVVGKAKLNQKRYRSFEITKDIGQEAFQLKLP